MIGAWKQKASEKKRSRDIPQKATRLHGFLRDIFTFYTEYGRG